jgi:hypothetical protein
MASEEAEQRAVEGLRLLPIGGVPGLADNHRLVPRQVARTSGGRFRGPAYMKKLRSEMSTPCSFSVGTSGA